MSASTSFVGRSSMTSRIIILVLLLVATVFLLRTTWHSQQAANAPPQPDVATSWKTETTSQATEVSQEPAQKHTTKSCQELPGADKVLVLMKTGASEIYQKLPIHLMTTLQCVPNYKIYSDLEQQIGDFAISDALLSVTESTRNRVSDFGLHGVIAAYDREGQDMTRLPTGWILDKYKFLPMLHEAFESAESHIEWFLLVEPDTSLSWLNLLLWLDTMDSREPRYSGSQNNLGETTFAHGGSGVLISRGAADKLRAARSEAIGGSDAYDRKWEKVTEDICCGDVVVAKAFLEVGVQHTAGWPLLQGESINTVDWTHKHWCTPSVTWHHVTSKQVDSLWHFQDAWAQLNGWNMPYLFRDLFHHFIEPHISANRTSWNNISNDHKYDQSDPGFQHLQEHEKSAVRSPDACYAACTAMPETECIQWMWTPGKCHLGRDIRYGSSDEQETVHWTSGWIQDRVMAHKKRLEGCQVNWRGI